MVTEEEIWSALHAVIDPELELDFVDLGLVYNVRIEDADVHIEFTLTTPACGIGPMVADEMDEVVGSLEGVRSVFPRLIFEPRWTPDKMSEDARFALGL
ncbi:metal-sulfur cluster assembly factor [Paraconexibacter antarcticus]|uniref:Metal-sulfur cluster assembly factor n=1 Tax=Paraconexibacter antarcticus TaxID=2949664 RepID=A0ABY5E235_9ACTN|nr:metal-sulfur cluster assembly factor [Paraconexibacter antarcticus]UTI66894.1 metal-sulfur cluster assembly factor [Paraconexibacter antarcticus]